MPPSTIQIKHDRLLELLSDGGDVTIRFDATRAGICVPSHLINLFDVTLVIGYNRAQPIPDLKITHDTISATLIFSGQLKYCIVPISTLFQISNGSRQSTWWDSVPPSLMSAPTTKPPLDSQLATTKKSATREKAKKLGWRVIK